MGNMMRIACALGVGAVLLACGSDDPVTASAGGGELGGGGALVGGGGAGGEGGGVGGCVPLLPVDAEVPELLSATGLYDDIANKQVAAHALPFVPAYELWSDDAAKQRWIYLPACTPIDTSDMNDWSLPVGARMWKEFRSGGVLVETRLIERVGEGANDFLYAAYLWDSEETEANRVPLGRVDALGTSHDVPDEEACRRCHGSHERGGGRPSRALGVSALQLSHDGPGLTLDGLAAAELLSHPPAASYGVPGNATERAALGYLHANCGHCHNDTIDRVPQVSLSLWLDVDVTTVATASAYLTAVGQPNAIFNAPPVTARVEPGQPSTSSVWFRMNQRGNNAQMPPLASEVVDAAGLAAVESWIGSLP